VLLRSKRWVRKEQELGLLPLSVEEEALIAQDLRRFERSQEIRA
jgi:hypothetical protein